jgi:transposase InsO family protein
MGGIDQAALTAAAQGRDVTRSTESSSQTKANCEDFCASRLQRISKRASPSNGSLHSAKWLLLADPEQEPLLGSHLVTSRRGYLHHGIYVGGGKIVHYAGLAHGIHRRPVEETTLDRFARGRLVWVRSDPPPTFSSREVIHRARSRIGEDGYRLLTNNCEHFCEWCLHGEHRSYQVDAWLARPGRALHAAIRLIARRLSAPGRIGLRPARATAGRSC